MSELYLGVEIGGTKQQIAVCDANGNIIKMVSDYVAIPNGASDIIAWIDVKLSELLSEYKEIKGIGIGFGGILETATGRLLCSVQVPGWENYVLKSRYEEKLGLPVTVVNDTVAGGYAEKLLGAGRHSEKFFYTNIGTGIGGSLFLGDKTYDGIGYGASYLGNTFAADWTSDIPGAVAKIENLCSGTAIEKRLRTPGYVPTDSYLYTLCDGDVSALNCRKLKTAAEKEDAFALAELDRVGHTFGMGVANMITMLGVDTVALGGGVANLGELILAPIRKYADKYVFISGKDKYKIVQCELMDNNVPVGSALYAKNGFDAI